MNQQPVTVITGAASGIGLALTNLYLESRHLVVMVDKNTATPSVQELKTKYPEQVYVKTCDVRDKSAVELLAQHCFNELGRIDFIYNNAGIIGQLVPIWELPIESITQVMDVNLFGMINMIQAFTPLLFTQQHRSRIVNMASLYALCSGSQMAAYSMSKHAVLSLSESLYFDLRRLDKPVDVSVVFPSFTDTGLLTNSASTINPSLQESLKDLLTHSRPAMDVAMHIAKEVEQQTFYILPDKEVKSYCEERSNAILMQETPHVNSIERLMNALMKRNPGIHK